MATRYLGLGTVISVDPAGGSTFATVNLIVNGKPPALEREEVDDTVLGDTLQTNTPGIEKHSHAMIRIKRDGADTQHVALMTLFGSKAIATWKITYTDGKLWTYSGWIQKYEPQTIEHNKHIEDEIVISRTSAITIA